MLNWAKLNIILIGRFRDNHGVYHDEVDRYDDRPDSRYDDRPDSRYDDAPKSWYDERPDSRYDDRDDYDRGEKDYDSSETCNLKYIISDASI